MGKTTPLRRELKRIFFPYLAAKGFVKDMRYAPDVFAFRKIEGTELRICDIQWDGYGGPRFAINFGVCSADGVEYYGELVPATEVIPSQCPRSGRLVPGSHATTRGWFRQDRTILQRIITWSPLRTPEEVVRELLSLFGEVEAYWETGRVGRHIGLFGSPSKPKP